MRQGKSEGLQEGLKEGLNKGIQQEIFTSVQEKDYSIERGAQKLDITVEEMMEKMKAAGYHLPV